MRARLKPHPHFFLSAIYATRPNEGKLFFVERCKRAHSLFVGDDGAGSIAEEDCAIRKNVEGDSVFLCELYTSAVEDFTR